MSVQQYRSRQYRHASTCAGDAHLMSRLLHHEGVFIGFSNAAGPAWERMSSGIPAQSASENTGLPHRSPGVRHFPESLVARRFVFQKYAASVWFAGAQVLHPGFLSLLVSHFTGLPRSSGSIFFGTGRMTSARESFLPQPFTFGTPFRKSGLIICAPKLIFRPPFLDFRPELVHKGPVPFDPF